LWRAIGPADANYTLAVHLQDADSRQVGELNIYPGRGNYATSLWREGALFRETVWVTVREPVEEPILGRVKVAFFRPADGGRLDHLTVTDPLGQEIGDALIIGRFRLSPPLSEGGASAAALARFGDAIELSAVEWDSSRTYVTAGESFAVTFHWRAIDRPSADYRVFVHLADSGAPVGFGDGQPDGGRLPTGLWEAGDVIEDARQVQVSRDAAEGVYRLLVGLYDADGRRPEAVSAEGVPLPDQALDLGEVTIRRLRPAGYIPLLCAGDERGTSEGVGNGEDRARRR
jgi:hypothetical protein